MNPLRIAQLRLVSQRLNAEKPISARDIVSWMGAIQAQDFPMAKWAIGVRSMGSTETIVDTAINKGEILRIHLLRPTWHFVAAEDIHWMLELSSAQIKSAQGSRDRALELTEEIYSKSNEVLEKTISVRGHLSREQLVAELNRAGIATDQNRAAHILSRAELEKIICSGPIVNGKPTYALLSERVPNARNLSKDEALAELARRYFTSRCPASLQDFRWWSGLSAGDANQALELVKSDFVAEKNDRNTYWLPQNNYTISPDQPSAYLLPTYDEFIISYTDRSATITADLDQQLKKISDRGVFRPIIIVRGQTIGIWKRTIRKDHMILDIELFKSVSPANLELIQQSAYEFGRFSGKQIEFVNSSTQW